MTNPIFEAPDEVSHYLYVRHLSETGTLPRFDDLKLGNLNQHEAFQAPLYYLTAALLTSWAPRGDIAEITSHNFPGSLGNPEGTGNRNMSLHGPDQRLPYQGEVLTVHLVRFVTTLWGAAALAFTFLAARRVPGSALSLVLPAVLFPWTVIRPAYAQPIVIQSATPGSARPLNLDLEGKATLLGVDTDPPDWTRVQPGDTDNRDALRQGTSSILG